MNRDPWTNNFDWREPGPERDVQRDISAVMADVVRAGAPKGPSSMLPPAPTVAPPVVREIPLGPRPAYEVGLIDALAQKFLGGPNEPVK